MNFHENFRLMERIRELEIDNRKLRAELDVKPLGAAVIDKLRRTITGLEQELDNERLKLRNMERLYVKAMQHVPGPAYVKGLEPTSYAPLSEMKGLRQAVREATGISDLPIPNGKALMIAKLREIAK